MTRSLTMDQIGASTSGQIHALTVGQLTDLLGRANAVAQITAFASAQLAVMTTA